MRLGQLIQVLETFAPEDRAPWGFANPHSYRGFYEQLAFEPAVGVTYGEMLASAREALGSTYEGWKGGDYTMHEDTNVWIADRGDTGRSLEFTFMLGTDGWIF